MNVLNLSILWFITHFCVINTNLPVEALQTDDYTFSLGYETVTAKENVKEFFKNKDAFKSNLYNNDYFVILQFYDSPSKEDVYEGMRQKINLIHQVNEVTYIASFSKKTSRRVFKKFGVRSIIPISSDMKLEKGLKETLQDTSTLKVNLVVSKSIKKSFIMKELKGLGIKGASEIFKESTNKYMITVNQKQLNTLVNAPWIIQIEGGGMR